MSIEETAESIQVLYDRSHDEFIAAIQLVLFDRSDIEKLFELNLSVNSEVPDTSSHTIRLGEESSSAI